METTTYSFEEVDATTIPERPSAPWREVVQDFLNSGTQAAKLNGLADTRQPSNVATSIRNAAKQLDANIGVVVRGENIYLVRH